MMAPVNRLSDNLIKIMNNKGGKSIPMDTNMLLRPGRAEISLLNRTDLQ